MMQDDKELLLKDLCARFTCRTMVKCNTDGHHVFDEELSDIHIMNFYQFEIKPYLRPMSSMTEEEKKELERLIDEKLNKHIGQEDDEWTPWVLYDTTGIKNYVGGERFYFDEMCFIYDWFNAHHFDYRGLIEKGLAIEAPEIMYKHFGDMDVVVTSVEHKDKL
jgi:hypothetical protein